MWRMYVLLLIRTQPNLEVGLARLYPNLNELKRKILPKIILDSALSDHNYFWTLIFRIKLFSVNIFFNQTSFFDHNFLELHFFVWKIFQGKNHLGAKSWLDPYFVGQHFSSFNVYMTIFFFQIQFLFSYYF